MSDLDAYIAHARNFGGLRAVWDVAERDLNAIEAGELAAALRALGSGRGASFTLSRRETDALVARLIDAGLDDAEVCRMAGASKARVAALRREPAVGELSVTTGSPMNPPSPAAEGAREPLTARKSPNGRLCAWCSIRLPAGLKAGARYCPGGTCKQAAHRARISMQHQLERTPCQPPTSTGSY